MSKSATKCQNCGAKVKKVIETNWFESQPKVQKTPQNVQASGPRLLLLVVGFLLMGYASIKSGGNWIILLLTLCFGYAVYVDWKIMKKWLQAEADAKLNK